MGADGGCFASAVDAVRKFGGVLEHPEATHAWAAFGIVKPPKSGGWVDARDGMGSTCCVEQGHYGHLARKATWLYYVGKARPVDLIWGPAQGRIRVGGNGYHSAEERASAVAAGTHKALQSCSSKQRLGTPIAFRDVLIGLAQKALDNLGELC